MQDNSALTQLCGKTHEQQMFAVLLVHDPSFLFTIQGRTCQRLLRLVDVLEMALFSSVSEINVSGPKLLVFFSGRGRDKYVIREE